MGAPDETVRAAMAEAATGDQTSYLRAVASLCTTRLLLPIGPADDGDLSAILLESASGPKAVIVFTGADLFGAWAPGARPVPCTLDDVAATAIETGSKAVVIDCNGEHPLVLEAELLQALAQGRRLVELAEGGFGWMFVQPDSPPEARHP